ncbi:MAG: hypothetical protein QM758_13140 [Armatimonas sp.]
MSNNKHIPMIDKRLAAVCQRLRGLADQIGERWRYGVVHLFVEEHIIRSHRHWKLEVILPELEDYMYAPKGHDEVPLPPSVPELCAMFRKVIEGCKGIRGIESPCAPSSELLHEIVELLRRAPPVPLN